MPDRWEEMVAGLGADPFRVGRSTQQQRLRRDDPDEDDDEDDLDATEGMSVADWNEHWKMIREIEAEAKALHATEGIVPEGVRIVD